MLLYRLEPCLKVRVVGSNPLPGTGSFFSSFLFLHLFPSFPYTALLPRCMRVCGHGPARLSGGPSYHRLRSTINIPLVVYLTYGSTANFRLDQYIKRTPRLWRSFWSKNLRNWPSNSKVIAIFPGAKWTRTEFSCHVIERTRDLIYLKFVATDFSPKIIIPSAGENSGDSGSPCYSAELASYPGPYMRAVRASFQGEIRAWYPLSYACARFSQKSVK